MSNFQPHVHICCHRTGLEGNNGVGSWRISGDTFVTNAHASCPAVDLGAWMSFFALTGVELCPSLIWFPRRSAINSHQAKRLGVHLQPMLGNRGVVRTVNVSLTRDYEVVLACSRL